MTKCTCVRSAKVGHGQIVTTIVVLDPFCPYEPHRRMASGD